MTLGDTTTGVQDIIFDGEVPRSFTGRAREVLSGGQFVTVSGVASVIGSTAALFNPGSITVALINADADQNVGIALHNAGSNEIVTVATRGMYITRASDSISGGYAVLTVSGTIQSVIAAVGVVGSSHPVGRAITPAGSENFLLVNFNF